MAKAGKYRAPALQRGLEILEALASARRSMSLAALCGATGKSVGELFRVLQVLEEEGYVSISRAGYRATDRLFHACVSEPLHDPIDLARLAMKEIAQATQQSCYLATLADSDAIILAYTPGPGFLCLTAEPGMRIPLANSAAGAILMAYQPKAVQQCTARQSGCGGNPTNISAVRRELVVTRMQGFAIAPNPAIGSVTDISVPVRLDDYSTAALTIPFLADRQCASERLLQARQILCSSASSLSTAIQELERGPEPATRDRAAPRADAFIQPRASAAR
jgi:DNA-binding IclR family transcriptional regulator